MRWAAAFVAATCVTALAVACTSSYGSADATPPLDASTADVVAPPSDAGADADAARACDSIDAALCLDFDGPPNPLWTNQRRENGSTVDVDTTLGNPGASLHATMPGTDGGVSARAQDEISFPVRDGPMHVELDVYVKKPTPPLGLATNSVFSVFILYWGNASLDTTVVPSNVDTKGALGIYAVGSTPQNFGPSAPFPFDTWIHLALDAQLTSGVGHFKLVGPGIALEDSPSPAAGPAQFTSLTLGIGRYNGATPQLDVWYDNIVVSFP